MRQYRDFVAAQSKRNPSTGNLVAFLEQEGKEQCTCRLRVLEFSSDGTIAHQYPLEASALAADLQQPRRKDNGGPIGRMIIVEDLTRATVEVLGAHLHLDPLFFASHLHSPWPEISTQTPDFAMLPSRVRPDEYVNIHYHRTIVFDDPEVSPRQLLRTSNVHRKVVILPKTKNTRLGFAQHCCSVFKKVFADKVWLCLVLVDPPIAAEYFSIRGKRKDGLHSILPSSLFLGGYEDFLDPPLVNPGSSSALGPSRLCLLDDLVYYWRRQLPEGFDANLPHFLHLAYYPMRIVAAEWVSYLAVMHHSIKQYEYTVEDLPSLVEELDRLNEDLRSLQSWRRRSMSSQQKMRLIARFIRSSLSIPSPDQSDREVSWKQLLAQDYDHLAFCVDDFGQRFERMLPVVTSMVQIADSRRSFAETQNVSRLTYLALVFVPLTFTTGLFSMNSNIAPGSPQFWIFFAVSIPVTISVFLIARPPSKLFDRIQEYCTTLWRPQGNLSNTTRSVQPTVNSESHAATDIERLYAMSERQRGMGRRSITSSV